MDTRAAKTGLAGPRAVAAWVAGGRSGHDRRGRLTAGLAGAERTAQGMAAPARVSADRVDAALAAGLADVQARYATWSLGNLVEAIDRHLGEAAALGVPAADRAGYLETLARRVLDPAHGYGVVALTGIEPVPVPAELCRGDGTPQWRPHEARRFATAAQLATEAGVLAAARGGGARSVAVHRDEPVLERAGLSVDQDAAVRGILTSGRHGEVLVGPAGTGKSRTIGTLAHAWAAGTGGVVYGVATAQVATANLAGDGLTALNTTRFLAAVTPDPVTGQARTPLHPADLVVVDEASMTSTGHLAAISAAAARVGAKVVYVGDPAQLAAVEAGGLFAHLAASLPPGQVHVLEQPHRFTEGWEAEASLRLRQGEPAAVAAYDEQGRLVTGSVEAMAAAARRGWLADRVAGLDAVLVVGSNAVAGELAAELQGELRDLGLVGREVLGRVAGGGEVSRGDVIETRRNAWGLRVDPAPDGTREAVLNRGRYTVVGVEPDGTVLGRDRHGATAHLPAAYLAEHGRLGYAATVHAAEGVTADAGHLLVDRDATREAVYVGMTRGRAHNYAYLVTEREPDAHDPQRVAETAAERLAAVLEVSGAEHAASRVAAADEAERSSAPELLARLDAAGRARVAPQLATVREWLGVDLDADPWAAERLTAALRAVDLAGRDPAAALDQALAARGLADADSAAAVLAHRLRGSLLDDPAADTTAREWTGPLRADRGDELSRYTGELADVVETRQRELGDRVAAEAPGWAAALGERPDPAAAPDAEKAWRHAAGVTAFYRESAGLDPEQVSLGAPPPRERPLDRALYQAALDAAGDSGAEPGRRDWRTAPDAELYAARESWARDVATAPEWVAEELRETRHLARGYREDATIEAARAETMAPGAGRDEVAADADRAAGFATQHEARAAELETARRERALWWLESRETRDAAAAAADELERRRLPAQRGVDDAATPQPPETPRPAVAPPEPEPAPTRERAPASSIGRSLDEEMLLDEEVRGHARDAAQRHGPTLDRADDLELDR